MSALMRSGTHRTVEALTRLWSSSSQSAKRSPAAAASKNSARMASGVGLGRCRMDMGARADGVAALERLLAPPALPPRAQTENLSTPTLGVESKYSTLL
eukprot:scaffold20337_cov30-Tisochrysis_lutea.AAC.3